MLTTPVQGMTRAGGKRLIATLALGIQVAFAGAAGAQTRIDLIPSATIGSIYDNNLFAQTHSTGGRMLVLTPGGMVMMKSPRFDLVSDVAFDAQHSNFGTLTTIDARRHAMVDLHYKTSPAMTVGFGTRYDRSQTPGDVDLDTGFLGDRLQAHRIQITPSLEYRIRRGTFARASYDWVDERVIEGANGQLRTLRSGLTQEWGQRANLTASFTSRQFVDRFETNSSTTALVGAERVIAPGTRISFQAGPRFSTYRAVRPEVLAGYVRSTDKVGIVVDYWHGETIVIGINGPVAVDNLAARAVFPLTQNIEIGTHTGVAGLSSIDATRATVYRGTLVATWKPRDSWYTVGGSYGIDYQLGDIRHGRVFLDGVEFIPHERVLRHVLRVSLTVAPRLSRQILSPEDPAARAKGVHR
jgi:hypothetical protein